ncbi:hypothetical protein PGTUg99_010589 [Puccinia graminis f. sp. tritici]|uniref:Secreted protein n=1 Tax=Puccinia graminis f. sp. tritici TaxID=56615 RepID=A0A5B0RV61_PUCGR|nr:hypothetical protein PGTUg99_010589 [Puccinia graminis f. sp. tritici]
MHCHTLIVLLLLFICTPSWAVNRWRRCGVCSLIYLDVAEKKMDHIRQLSQTGTTSTKTCGELKPEKSSCNYVYPVELFICKLCDAHAWVITTEDNCPRHRQPEEKYFDPKFPDDDEDDK